MSPPAAIADGNSSVAAASAQIQVEKRARSIDLGSERRL
jgi:hypothetical protein